MKSILFKQPVYFQFRAMIPIGRDFLNCDSENFDLVRKGLVIYSAL